MPDSAKSPGREAAYGNGPDAPWLAAHVREGNVPDMQSHLSPKDLALLIGVSESSLKRWVDDGRLRAERTAGGHRRIAMAEAVRFIRETASVIADPALMRLPELNQAAVDAAQNGEAERAILSAALDRDTARATGILIAEFLRSRAVAAVCDGPMTMLLNQAEQEDHGAAATGSNVHPGTAAAICKDTTQRISALLAEPRADAPVAVVSAVGTDTAGARALMAEAVLRECHYRVVGAELAAGNGHAGRESLVCMVFDRGAILPADQRRQPTDSGVETVWFGPGVAGLPPRAGVRIVHSLSELACVSRAARPASGREVTSVRTTRSRVTT